LKALLQPGNFITPSSKVTPIGFSQKKMLHQKVIVILEWLKTHMNNFPFHVLFIPKSQSQYIQAIEIQVLETSKHSGYAYDQRYIKMH
jgi:hypothetical protein